MNGPEHYAEAERLIRLAESQDWTTRDEPYRDPALAAAQVHATLAAVAAAVIPRNTQPGELREAWDRVVNPR